MRVFHQQGLQKLQSTNEATNHSPGDVRFQEITAWWLLSREFEIITVDSRCFTNLDICTLNTKITIRDSSNPINCYLEVWGIPSNFLKLQFESIGWIWANGKYNYYESTETWVSQWQTVIEDEWNEGEIGISSRLWSVRVRGFYGRSKSLSA